MENQNEVVFLEINGKHYTLVPQPFDDEIDIAEYLQVDYNNLYAEMITMPIVLNQISNLRAELETLISRQKMANDILRATLEKAFKASRNGGARVTIAEVENHVLLDPQYQQGQSTLIELQKNYNYMDGFYWSAQAKINMLNKISDKIAPEEFSSELLEKKINNVLVKRFRRESI